MRISRSMIEGEERTWSTNCIRPDGEGGGGGGDDVVVAGGGGVDGSDIN